MNKNYKALIFDLDGTLVDSAPIVDQIMKDWCRRNEIDFDAIQDSAFSSRTQDTVRSIAPHLNAELEAKKIEAMEREALTGLEEIKGASRFLYQLPEGRWAVATSSDLHTAEAKLEAANLKRPSVLVASDLVRSGKPHPETYLEALCQLGCEAADCLTFEDSDTGLQSALSAGCDVVMVGDKCGTIHERIVERIKDFEEIELLFEADSSFRIKRKIAGSDSMGTAFCARSSKFGKGN